MRAVRIYEFGGPEKLTLEEIPTPEPGPREARVKIEYTGVNFADIYSRKGQYPGKLPLTLGLEAAGTVDALGPGVSDVRIGDRVAYAMHVGAYADCAVVPAWKLVPVPVGVTTQEAAAIMLQGMTAHYLSSSAYALGSADTALIHAAAGGTGQLLVQMAKRRSARVIATTSTEEKAQLARQAGADEVILYTQTDFAAEARRLTGGRGVDVVYDSVGQSTFDKSLEALRPRGLLVLFGQSSGPVKPFDPQVLNARGSLYLTRPTLGDYTAEREELLQRAGDVFRWLADGEIKPRIDRVFPLEQAAQAHEYLEGRNTKGKVLLAQ